MEIKRKIYLDTSVISALFDSRTPERMELTKASWETINNYNVYISELVVDELRAAPVEKRKQFMDTISKYTVLNITKEAENLANDYINEGIFPEKYIDDALHVAIASINDIRYILSWNFKHLVKVKTRRMVSLLNTKLDYPTIEIIAPPEL